MCRLQQAQVSAQFQYRRSFWRQTSDHSADNHSSEGENSTEKTSYGLLGPSAKFTTVRFLPIKSLVEKHIPVEKSCNVRDNLTSCSLLRRTGATLHHTFRLRCQCYMP